LIDPKPLSDLTLSMKARGLYALFVANDRVMSPGELLPLVPEGREAIRSAMHELISRGYVRKTQYQSNTGQFVHSYEAVTITRYGKPVTGEPVTLHSGTAVSDTANSYKVLAIFPNGNMSNTARIRVPGEIEEEFVEMPWPGFEPEEVIDKSKPSRIGPAPEDTPTGKVGRVEDKVAARNAKYKKTTFEALPASMRRGERPESEWTTADLVAELYDLVREHAPNVPSQVNGADFAKWVNRTVGQGATRFGVLRALRAFFNDPRNLRDLGVGKPLWRRFLAFYPSVHGTYAIDATMTYEDPNFDAHSAKMAKLLED
jgi:hypothetical protein